MYFPPHLRQLTIQFSALFAILSLAYPYYGLRQEALSWGYMVIGISGLATLFAILSRQRWWWQLIHACFAPLAWLVAQLEINPGWFLGATILLLLIYRGALSGQVPLYLSSRETALALAELRPPMPQEQYDDRDNPGKRIRFIDLGAGVGSLLRPLATARSDIFFTGVEDAPLTWLIGRLTTFGRDNLEWCWGNMWQTPLNDYTLVYAFLSPVAMPDLWQKAQAEMQSGSWLISNSFPVPDVTPEKIVEVGDTRQTRLYCYRI